MNSLPASITTWLKSFNEESQWFTPSYGVMVLLKKQSLHSYHNELEHNINHWQLQICIIDVDDEHQNKGAASSFIKNCLDFINHNIANPLQFKQTNTCNCYVSLQINECQTERFCNFLKRIGGTITFSADDQKHPDVLF